MFGLDEILNLVFDNLKQLIFPEEWLAVDLEMSKQELLALLLMERHGEIIMSQLADLLNIPMSTATGIADRLVKKDYLVRDRAETDRRIVIIRLSAKGKTLTTGLKTRLGAYIQQVDAMLTEEERQTLFTIITKIIRVWQEPGNQPEPASELAGGLRPIRIE